MLALNMHTNINQETNTFFFFHPAFVGVFLPLFWWVGESVEEIKKAKKK